MVEVPDVKGAGEARGKIALPMSSLLEIDLWDLFPQYLKNLIFFGTYFLKTLLTLFWPLKIISDSWWFLYTVKPKNLQEIKRIFKGQKRICKGFFWKINVTRFSHHNETFLIDFKQCAIPDLSNNPSKRSAAPCLETCIFTMLFSERISIVLCCLQVIILWMVALLARPWPCISHDRENTLEAIKTPIKNYTNTSFRVS